MRPPQLLISIAPLKTALQRIRDGLEKGDVAILASGDPLFFGIGRTLITTFGREAVRIYPAVSSIQQMFARFAIPWDSAAFVSLHGRSHRNRLGKLLSHRLTAVLTDNTNRPETIAHEIERFVAGYPQQVTIHVAENLGMADERCSSGTPQDISTRTFGSLCCMLIVLPETPAVGSDVAFGLMERDIVHSRGLITKSEVRAAVLHALAIPANSVMWDVGAGSGSVGLEAARMQKDMLVYAIEKQAEQQQNIRRNQQKYGAINLRLIPGGAPEMLVGLPRPHTIFIGGSGGELARIISHCARELLPGGRIVVTAVIDTTLKEAPRLLHQAGLQVELRRIEVQRSSYPMRQQRLSIP